MYGNLKIFRESLGMTQKEFAASLSIGSTTYNGYETGARDPKSDFWISVATKYGVTIDYLMGYSDDPHKTSDEPNNKTEISHIEKYRSLDGYGKEAVDSVLDVEWRRCKEEEDKKKKIEEAKRQREQIEAAAEIIPEKIVRFRVAEYLTPMSAGTGEIAVQEYPQDIELVKAPPRGTSFIAHVTGESMEPTYHDGDMVFVHAADEIPVGSVGVFYMDGQQWIKEYRDGFLISHNPSYEPRQMTEDIRCQGLVLGVCDDSYFE